MLVLRTLAGLAGHVGEQLGSSDWLAVDQLMIDRFAELTGDRNWYHVDVTRARKELPGGRTIAHGLLTLSLVPGLGSQIVQVTHPGRALNYGLNKVRFPAPVPVDSRLRLHMSVRSADMEARGLMILRDCRMELEGSERPAMTAEMLTLVLVADRPGEPP
jgi:acyl dehydratase